MFGHVAHFLQRQRHAGWCPNLASIAAAAVMLAAAAADTSAAELRGLVVGVDKYRNLAPKFQLKGAVNDALDIAQALEKAGALEVMLLTDDAASKAAVVKGWKDLIARSSPGDVVVFSYAGHGSQEPDTRGEEVDGKNENFILGGFNSGPPDNNERIVDDEMFDLLKLADDKGVKTIMVADSCHSGTMFRSASASGVTFRNLLIPEITDDQLSLPPPSGAGEDPAHFKHVTFIGATEESRVVPEIDVDGKKRGAMSYAFARALEGGADRNKDGVVTQSELVSFLIPKVYALVEGQQAPQVLPVRAGAEPLIVTRKDPPPPPPPPPSADLLRVFVKGGSGDLVKGITGVIATDDPGSADVIWDTSTGVVEHVVGGKVAENIDGRSIVPVLGKWSSMKWLQSHATGAPGEFILHSGNQRYLPGTKIDLSFKGAERPYMTLFNLAPDGRVEFFVEPNEVEIDWRGKQSGWQFRPDKPPFGSEHMLAILTDEPLVGLHNSLKTMNTADRAIALREALEGALGGTQYQLGQIGIYTGTGG